MTQNGPSPKSSSFGGLLFRTLGNDEETNEPLPFADETSPFSAPPSASTVALTVADVLPQLPPDLARATSIPQDQPVQISPAVLGQALSSGQLAIPLFEVYRVCPGIFQAPVSPDDARMVQLPPSKLSSFVTMAAAASAAPPASSGPIPASPFAAASPSSPFAQAAVGQPFNHLFEAAFDNPTNNTSAAAAKPGATQLPPRRDPAQPPAMSIPPAPALQMESPFAAPASASPFASAAPTLASPPPSPFPSQPVSPFAMAPLASEPPALAAEPFSSAAPAAASPFGQASFTPPPAMPTPPAPAFAPAPSLAGPATASVASLLSKQSADELGFDPAMIPSWINTQFHGGLVAELQAMAEPKIELGSIVDGITDVGFRNVLHSAQRNHLVPISMAQLTPVQATATPTEAAPASAAPATVMRVEPPAQALPPAQLFASPPSEPATPQFRQIEPGNPFAQVPEAPPIQPAKETPLAAPAEPKVAPTFPGLIQPISASLEQLTNAISALPQPPAAPPSPPAAAAPAPAPAPAPKPTEPAPSPFSGFAAAMDPFAPAGDPPPKAGASNLGFSSFDLLGGAPAQESPPPSLFPEAEETPTLFQAEVPEIPTTVEKPEPKAAPTAPSSGAASWAAFAEQVVAAEERKGTEPAPIAAPPVIQTQAEPAPFIPAAEPFSPSMPSQPTSAPMFSAPAPTFRPASAAKSSMGLSSVAAGAEEQLMLRAMLDTDEELTIARVMELTVGLPGITACALIKGDQVLAGESTKGSDARAFRAQAAEVARSLKTLAPLIGIADAETFTLNTDCRLITLCFPGAITLGILHDREPTLGLRDKLTLIARQLERMVAHG